MKNSIRIVSIEAFYLLENVVYPFESDCLICRGSVVFACVEADYGLTLFDSMSSGEPYIAVTLNPGGDYPFWTVPRRILVPAVPAFL
jgi:hypothetical protein